MRVLKSISISLVIALALLSIPAIAMAEDASTRATLTFSQAIEVPGVVLMPGTYVFRTVGNDKHMVQVMDVSETHVYATLLTTVNYLNTPAAKTGATFSERGSEAPQALKSFQIANQNVAEEFIYGAVPASTAAAEPKH